MSRSKIRIPFYSTLVVFMHGYLTTSSYEITKKTYSVLRSRWAPYNCPHMCHMLEKNPQNARHKPASEKTGFCRSDNSFDACGLLHDG